MNSRHHIAIIYHSADFDGKLSNEVCRFHLSRLFPEATVQSYGWDHGQPVPTPLISWWDPDMGDQFSNKWEDHTAIYIVDLAVDELMARPELRDKIVWIDHHISSINKWDRKSDHSPGPGIFTGYRIDGVAACRLCWQWFSADQGPHGDPRTHPCDYWVPSKEDYVNRAVMEPELIRLVGEYDVWDHRDQNAKALQFGLRVLDDPGLRTAAEVAFANGHDAVILLQSHIVNGRAIKSYCDKQNDEYSKAYARTIDWEGLKFCALNIGQLGNSDLLRGGLKPEHQACFAWRHNGERVVVSLYHAPGHEHIDLFKIAVKYGGGGHKGACGFRISLDLLSEILAPKQVG